MSRRLFCSSFAALLAACASGGSSAAPARVSVATATAGDLTVELLTDGALATGMSPIHLDVRTSSGQRVTDAAVAFAPRMAMAGGTAHGAPVVGTPTVGEDGLYHCAVVFQMASSEMDTWSATATVTRPGAAPVEATFPSLPVSDAGRARTFTSTDPDTSAVTRYVMSFNLEAAPRVGLNPVAVTLHTMGADRMTFPPVDDATFGLDPEMPSMEHGAPPGSVAPTPDGAGVYRGTVAFSMTGAWVITVSVRRGGLEIAAPPFDVTFY